MVDIFISDNNVIYRLITFVVVVYLRYLKLNKEEKMYWIDKQGWGAGGGGGRMFL